MLASSGDVGRVSSDTSELVEMAFRERRERLGFCRKLGEWVSEGDEQMRSTFREARRRRRAMEAPNYRLGFLCGCRFGALVRVLSNGEKWGRQ